jgi:hypothetical protein
MGLPTLTVSAIAGVELTGIVANAIVGSMMPAGEFTGGEMIGVAANLAGSGELTSHAISRTVIMIALAKMERSVFTGFSSLPNSGRFQPESLYYFKVSW